MSGSGNRVFKAAQARLDVRNFGHVFEIEVGGWRTAAKTWGMAAMASTAETVTNFKGWG